MNKREYLRSLGFEVGTRGRFNEAMLKALENYTEETPEVIITPKVKNTPKRTDGVKVYTAELHTGQIIRFDMCADCQENVIFCHCENPQAPEWLRPEVASYRLGE